MRNVYFSGVVYFVVSVGSDGESGDGLFVVIKHRRYIWWEDVLMFFFFFIVGLVYYKK